jgi:hypothetical protein
VFIAGKGVRVHLLGWRLGTLVGVFRHGSHACATPSHAPCPCHHFPVAAMGTLEGIVVDASVTVVLCGGQRWAPRVDDHPTFSRGCFENFTLSLFPCPSGNLGCGLARGACQA